MTDFRGIGANVAPPRGERGLKLCMYHGAQDEQRVAPPRGERGLKHGTAGNAAADWASLPLVGSVD